MSWDPEDLKYKCCCGSCHVKAGALTVAILALLGSSAMGCIAVAGNAWTSIWMWGPSLLCASLTVHGLRKGNGWLILPHVILQGIMTVAMGVGTVVTGVMGGVVMDRFHSAFAHHGAYYYKQEYELRQQFEGSAAGAVAVGVLLMLGLTALALWFFVLLVRAFQFLRAQASAESIQPSVVGYVMSTAGVGPPAYEQFHNEK